MPIGSRARAAPVPWSTQARTREGEAAAKTAQRWAPSSEPKSAARSTPAASMTARMSSRLERRQVRLVNPIREARAATVEDDDPRERPEAPQAACERVDAPHVFDVGREARHVHQVERPIAENLVGDVRAVWRLDVASLRRLHTLSLARIEWTRRTMELAVGAHLAEGVQTQLRERPLTGSHNPNVYWGDGHA